MNARHQPTLFGGAQRLAYDDAIEMTIASILAYEPQHPHWCVAWSGGKDSSALLTVLVHLIEVGRLPAPRSLTVFYADTRQELPPLQASARLIMKQLSARGIACEVVMAPMDKRFLVYMLGRGVPPPNNNTLRWCTRQIKVDPMAAAIERRLEGLDGSVLMLTGVRQGESAVRDGRIAMSCGKDGAECGQGWYQEVLPQAKGVRGRIATLAPLLHWRVCNVWDWLRVYAPMREYGGWATATIADAYGGDEASEIAARTGCIGCPLASQELALETVLAMRTWDHLAPLRGLKPLYRELREARHRLKKTGFEKTCSDDRIGHNGGPALIEAPRLASGKNKQRMGPLTFDARRMALARVEAIQAACNEAAERLGRPGVDILNEAEASRIRELIAAGTWPNGWDGDEPIADTPMDSVFRDGSVQPLML